jgi:predicted DsbA family dithiol-disulfide isomerase
LPAQRLVALTPVQRRGAVLDALYAAYFEHGQDIGDLQTLLRIAADHGLDPDWTLEQLQGNAGRAEVLEDLQFAHQAGISGVPFFVFDDRYAVSGAQPPETLLDVMRQVAGGSVEHSLERRSSIMQPAR